MQNYVLGFDEAGLKAFIRSALREELAEHPLYGKRDDDPPDDDEGWIDQRTAAKIIGCCTNTVLKLRKDKKLPYSKVRRQIKINKATLLKLLKNNKL